MKKENVITHAVKGSGKLGVRTLMLKDSNLKINRIIASIKSNSGKELSLGELKDGVQIAFDVASKKEYPGKLLYMTDGKGQVLIDVSVPADGLQWEGELTFHQPVGDINKDLVFTIFGE